MERCVLEPGGTFFIQRKMPPADQVQHEEVMRRLAAIDEKLARLAAGENRG